MERIKCEKAAADYLGSAYLRTPRVILDQVFSQRKAERIRGRVYLALFTLSNFAESYEDVCGERVLFGRGEFISSLSELSAFTGIKFCLLWYHLNQLRKKGLVEVEALGDRSRFRVLGYDRFTAPGQPGKQEAALPGDAARRVAAEEARVFGERKLRTDLVNYGV